VARSVIGVKLAVVVRQPSDEGSFRVSMRSSCDFDVSAICAEFGGGGHKKAAGCTVKAKDVEEAVSRLLEKIHI
jgi:phosphoesterase RecJ-like protein